MEHFNHGGNVTAYEKIYGRPMLDYSANISPLGMPKEVKTAAAEALLRAEQYPDPDYTALREAIARMEGCRPEQVLPGGGAADLIFRVVLAACGKKEETVRGLAAEKSEAVCRTAIGNSDEAQMLGSIPENVGNIPATCRIKALLPVPSFSEYEQALRLAGCEISYYELPEDRDFQLPEDFPERITPETDLLFLCLPNNPTGTMPSPELAERIAAKCRQTGTLLIADECFLEFPENPEAVTLKRFLPENPNLLILRAFTKSFAVPGIRIGYALSDNADLLFRMKESGPPWNVSCMAEAAGIAACELAMQGRQQTDEAGRTEATKEKQKQAESEASADGTDRTETTKEKQRQAESEASADGTDQEEAAKQSSGGYLEELRHLIQRERPKLQAALADLGLRVIPGEANFILFYGPEVLDERLAKEGILIRNCSNFQGLGPGWFRTAVRGPEENRQLVAAMERVLGKDISERSQM